MVQNFAAAEASDRFSPIFVVGCERSGTTLLRSILDAHSRIAMTPETHFFSTWFPKGDLRLRSRFRERLILYAKSDHFAQLNYPPEQFLADVAEWGREQNAGAIFAHILQTYQTSCKKPRVGEKTPYHYECVATFLRLFPNARIIWMLRDPRAVANSLKKTPWAGHRSPLGLAFQWYHSTMLWSKWRDHPNVLTIRYEDLVNTPDVTVRRVLSFVGEPYEETLWLRRQKIDDPQRGLTPWAREHYQSARRPITKSSLDAWHDQLGPRELRTIEAICTHGMRQAGYHPTKPVPSFPSRVTGHLLVPGRAIRQRFKYLLREEPI